jgi:hypothetical protein
MGHTRNACKTLVTKHADKRLFEDLGIDGAQVGQCGICGGQSGTGTDFFPSSSAVLCQYHSTIAINTHFSPGI